VHPTWFGAVRDGMSRVRRSGGTLRATTPEVEESFAWTSGGLREVVVAEYDAFLLVGLGFSFTSLARLYRDYRTPAQSQALRKRHAISGAAFDVAADGLVRGSLGMTLARVIRGITNRPILIAADPLPGEAAARGKEAELWQHLAAHPDGAALFAQFNAQAEREAKAAGITFLPQPAETRAALPYTRDALRRGAVRMRATGDTPFEEEDVGHMGPDYGAALLAVALGRLGDGPG
jgi:hypothetical protein